MTAVMVTTSTTALPRLVAITDLAAHGPDATRRAFAEVCARARPGSVAVQLRDRELSVALRLDWARELCLLCRRHRQWFLVNDRLDLAVLAEAHGVHLGEDSVSGADAAALLRAEPSWVFRAWHRLDEAPDPAAHALLVSPIVAARKGASPLGFEGLAHAVRRAGGRALYALGGLEPEHARAVSAAGARGIAAIGAVYQRPAELVAALGIESGTSRDAT